MKTIDRWRRARAGAVPALVACALLIFPGRRDPHWSLPLEDLGLYAEEVGGRGSATAVPGERWATADATASTWDIPIHRTPEVERWIEFYSSDPGRRYFEDWLDRMSRYEAPIREELRRRGMPEDLVYIALIESGFEPRAVSNARASGLWQIMPAAAREQGLLVSPYVDERFDPVRSTTAAIAFLESLHHRFGAWYLAVAAYNTGASRVQRALRARGGDGPWTEEDFWEIAHLLPEETRQHVPRLIAAAILGKEPTRFGFRPDRPEPHSFETVFTVGGTALRDVATAAGVSEEEVRTLNPHLVRSMVPPDMFYPVRVPSGTARRVVVALSTEGPGVAEGARLAE